MKAQMDGRGRFPCAVLQLRMVTTVTTILYFLAELNSKQQVN